MPGEELAVIPQHDVSLDLIKSEEIQVLKNHLLKGFTDAELAYAAKLAKEYGLSIIKKELMAYKQPGGQGKPDQIVVVAGRDGLLKAAAQDPNFAGVKSAPVYEKDQFEIDLGSGRVTHIPARDNRGALQGAWAVALRRQGEPVAGYYTTSEFVQKNYQGEPRGPWRTIPHLMIKKCAESTVLRIAFTGLASLYSDAEILPDEKPVQTQEEMVVQEKAKRQYKKKEAAAQAAPVEPVKEAPEAVVESKVEPETVEAPKNVFVLSKSPELVAARDAELAAKKSCSPSVALRIMQHWNTDALPVEIKAKRTEENLSTAIKGVTGRDVKGPFELTPTEAETLLSAVLFKNTSYETKTA